MYTAVNLLYQKGVNIMAGWIIHIILVVLGVAFFLYSFIKEKRIYQLLFVIWIPLTLLNRVFHERWQLWTLGIIQLIFFVLVIYFLFRNPARKKGMADVLEQLDSYGAEPPAGEEPAGEAVLSDNAEEIDTPDEAVSAADEAEETPGDGTQRTPAE